MQKENYQFITLLGSKKLDLFLIVIMAGLVLVASTRLKVYYKISAVRVRATHIFPDGRQVDVKVPYTLKRSGRAHASMAKTLSNTEHRIKDHMQRHYNIKEIPEGERYEWEIRYSLNNPKLDQKKVLQFP